MVKEYCPQMAEYRLPRARKANRPGNDNNANNNTYGWDQEESYCYVMYLMNFIQVFQEPLIRQKIRVFRRMAQLITSRSSQQIKSHHQKMMKKHNNSPNQAVNSLVRYLSKQAEENPAFAAEIPRLNELGRTFFERERPLMVTQLDEMLQRKERGLRPVPEKVYKHEQLLNCIDDCIPHRI